MRHPVIRTSLVFPSLEILRCLATRENLNLVTSVSTVETNGPLQKTFRNSTWYSGPSALIECHDLPCLDNWFRRVVSRAVCGDGYLYGGSKRASRKNGLRQSAA